jgi:hypothetical protein
MPAGFTSLFFDRHIDNFEEVFSSFECDWRGLWHLWWTGLVHTRLVEISEERIHLENLGVYRKENVIKIDLEEVGCEGIDCIALSQDRDRWLTPVNAVMNFGFHNMRGISLLPENLSASQSGLHFLMLVLFTLRSNCV